MTAPFSLVFNGMGRCKFDPPSLLVRKALNFMKLRLILLSILVYALACNEVNAWVGMAMPELKVEGRHLKDTHGNVVLLHGFAQTFSPWFNEQGSKWSNYDVNGCLSYNKGIIDKIMAAGWKVNFVRQHMDPYWSNTPGCSGRYEGEECFNESRFRKYLDEVFVPMAEYAVSKGLYVIMRPPGVFPENIEVGDVYNEYLINVWDIVSQHPKLKTIPISCLSWVMNPYVFLVLMVHTVQVRKAIMII